MTVSNIGSSAEDGVTIALDQVTEVAVHWAPLDATGPLDPDAMMILYGGGTFETDPNHDLGQVRMIVVPNIGSNGEDGVALTADFSAIGSVTSRVEVYDDGTLLGAFPGQSGTLATIAGIPDAASFQIAAGTEVRASTFVTIDKEIAISGGPTLVGDEVRIVPEGVAGTMGPLSGLRLQAANISEITLIDPTAGLGAPPAALVAASSRKTHAGVPRDIAVNTAGDVEAGSVSSEPRQGGIAEMRFAFDMAPGGPGPAPLFIEEQTGCPPGTQEAYGLFSGASTASCVVEDADLVCTFTPPLDCGRTYKITLGSDVTALPGQSVEVRCLMGDANGDGRVNAADRSTVVGVWTGPGHSAAADVSLDGATNATDRSLVVNAWTGGQNCAP